MAEDEFAEFDEKNKKPCNARLDELAKPNKRLVLSLYESYAKNFSPERREAIRLLVQELYALTPEETLKYFQEINGILKKLSAREKLKKRLKRRRMHSVWREARERAYCKFENLLSKGLMAATRHPIPPVVSTRIRTLSDVILEQLCDIRNINVPERNDADYQSMFLMNISDWLAIIIEQLYYEINVRKNEELDKIEKQIKADEESAKRRTKSKSYKSAQSNQ